MHTIVLVICCRVAFASGFINNCTVSDMVSIFLCVRMKNNGSYTSPSAVLVVFKPLNENTVYYP
jgi:hypothetical protein